MSTHPAGVPTSDNRYLLIDDEQCVPKDHVNLKVQQRHRSNMTESNADRHDPQFYRNDDLQDWFPNGHLQELVLFGPPIELFYAQVVLVRLFPTRGTYVLRLTATSFN